MGDVEKGCIVFTVVAILVISLVIGVPALSITWYKASVNRKLINEKFGTTYTTKEVFWAGETIEKLLEGEKHRIELSE